MPGWRIRKNPRVRKWRNDLAASAALQWDSSRRWIIVTYCDKGPKFGLCNHIFLYELAQVHLLVFQFHFACLPCCEHEVEQYSFRLDFYKAVCHLGFLCCTWQTMTRTFWRPSSSTPAHTNDILPQSQQMGILRECLVFQCAKCTELHQFQLDFRWLERNQEQIQYNLQRWDWISHQCNSKDM